MEADWVEIARVPHLGPTPTAASSPVTTFAFDTEQELLWTGNEYVSLESSPCSPLEEIGGRMRDLSIVAHIRIRAGSLLSTASSCSGIPPGERTFLLRHEVLQEMLR